ncbi:Pkinase-fungal domain-containing protein [Mycena indigotica]|uniref:Pkinase-fungal domain-containing protein n=1 Tax=Mycena indigotica TaxID=2126181 RepID=A0A8H6S4U2_9AGAR|nr:Pkinase-fungal domain-containing protein [Mycena indigotica]KAF7292836.1 Pkinase-fungal domain-containing protein [Mycena indigotica]
MALASQLELPDHSSISHRRSNLVPSQNTSVLLHTTNEDPNSVQQWKNMLLAGYGGTLHLFDDQFCHQDVDAAIAASALALAAATVTLENIPQLVQARGRKDENDMLPSLVSVCKSLVQSIPDNTRPKIIDSHAKRLSSPFRGDHVTGPDVVIVEPGPWDATKSVVEFLETDFIDENGEFKEDGTSINAAIQLAKSARNILASLGGTHVFVSAVFQHEFARIYRFDHGGFKASPRFPWITNPRPFATLLHRLSVPQTLGALQPEYTEGVDDTISPASPEEKKRLWTALCDDEFYSTIFTDEVIFNGHCKKFIAARRVSPEDPHSASTLVTCLQLGEPLSLSDGLFSRATRVCRVAILEDLPILKIYALKDAWKQGYRRNEIDFYDLIRVYVQNLNDIEKFHPGDPDDWTKKSKAFGMAKCHGMINLAEPYDPNQAPWQWRPELHKTSSQKDEVSDDDKALYERYHTRALITPVGCPLNQFPSTEVLCRGIMTACFHHEVAYNAGVQHCDLSEGNLMFDEKTMNSERPQVFLIDWDYAEFVKDDDSDGAALFKQNFPTRSVGIDVGLKEGFMRFTGTLPFMALGLLDSMKLRTPLRHKAYHDLESFFWIQIWMLSRYTNYLDDPSPDASEDSACSRIFGWADGESKISFIVKPLQIRSPSLSRENPPLSRLCESFRIRVMNQNPWAQNEDDDELIRSRSQLPEKTGDERVQHLRHFIVQDLYDASLKRHGWVPRDRTRDFVAKARVGGSASKSGSGSRSRATPKKSGELASKSGSGSKSRASPRESGSGSGPTRTVRSRSSPAPPY